MTSQMELDFTERRSSRAARPHHKTTTLTVSGNHFNLFCALPSEGTMKVMYVNDIVSSAAGGTEDEHHMLRRTSLLRRQLAGGWNKVKIRTNKDAILSCEMYELGGEPDDECFGTVWIRKQAAA